MDETETSVRNVVTNTLFLSVAFAFSQFSGFLLRIILKIELTDIEYGLFAYATRIFLFVFSFAHMFLRYPTIAKISENPNDQELYSRSKSQISSVTVIISIIASFILLFWLLFEGIVFSVSFILSCVLIVYAFGFNLHGFLLGRGMIKPTAAASTATGLTRFALILLLSFGIIEMTLEMATAVYAIPLVLWMITYLLWDSYPRPSKPKVDYIYPYFRDSSLSLSISVSGQVPIFLSILLLEIFLGYAAVGNFDIALIAYSAAALVISSIGYVTIAKARSFPKVRSFLVVIGKKLAFPIALCSIGLIAISSIFESSLSGVLLLVGLPVSIYWPAVILLAIAVPPKMVLEMFLSYLQGRGHFKLTAYHSFVSLILTIPLIIFFTLQWGIMGCALAVGLADLIRFLFLVIGSIRSKSI
jgi:O-antigen/teichoic acid export membrane protein